MLSDLKTNLLMLATKNDTAHLCNLRIQLNNLINFNLSIFYCLHNNKSIDTSFST